MLYYLAYRKFLGNYYHGNGLLPGQEIEPPLDWAHSCDKCPKSKTTQLPECLPFRSPVVGSHFEVGTKIDWIEGGIIQGSFIYDYRPRLDRLTTVARLKLSMSFV